MITGPGGAEGNQRPVSPNSSHGTGTATSTANESIIIHGGCVGEGAGDTTST
jgi:hypothetical protein